MEVNDVVAKTSISQLYLVAANGGDSTLMSAESVSSWGPVFTPQNQRLGVIFIGQYQKQVFFIWGKIDARYPTLNMSDALRFPADAQVE